MRVFLTCIFLVAAICLWGQDIHFSQFYQSPFSLNPALTGQFDGAWRFTGNQRSQWRSVSVPFRTIGIAADTRLEKFGGTSAGLTVFNDKTGDSKLTTTMVNLSAAHEWKNVGLEGRTVSAGLMLGITSMSIDYSKLRYDSQWSGLIYDPTMISGESFARDSRAYMNLHIGGFFTQPIGDRRVSAGLSVFNLTSPDQSWFDQAFVRLNPRWNLHGSYEHPLDEKWTAEPMLLIMSQASFREINVGGRAHYNLSDQNWMTRSVYGGVFARARDAGYLLVGMKYDAWDIGVSYDINLSTLRPASNGRGALEFGVIYILPPQPKISGVKKVCADYI